jgi:hypothetical protein
MSIVTVSRLIAVVGGAALAVLVGAGVAQADPPSAGDSCSQFGATTQDGNGQTMWCHHSQSGHSLAWQYGDSSNEHG